MSIFALVNMLGDAKGTIEQNPIGRTRSRQAASQVDSLAQRIDQLELRNKVLEALIAHALNLPPDKLAALVDSEMTSLSQRKAVEGTAKETTNCPSCQRPVHKNLKACQICGTPAILTEPPTR